MNAAPLQYHETTFRLLDESPRLSAEALEAIEQAEAACNARLPASLREWYSLEGAGQRLAQRADACGPSALETILDDFADAHAPEPSRNSRQFSLIPTGG